MADLSQRPRVAIVMGSDSDLPVMRGAAQALSELEVPHELAIVSAHRTPHEMATFAIEAADRGIAVIIAGAGGAAHLPGMIAAYTTLPVIGVPVPIGHLSGIDALLSIVQMPGGVPVATVAIGAAYNAGLLAGQILASGGIAPDPELKRRLERHKQQLKENVRAKQQRLAD